MTIDEAKKMLKAKLECLKRETSGTDIDCNYRNCDECDLCYEQGNMGEQKEALQMAIKALESQRWISVSERLPEDYIHVLCQFTLGGMGECYLAHGVFHVVGGLVMTCNEVIAWMPLPEPYAESEEEK